MNNSTKNGDLTKLLNYIAALVMNIFRFLALTDEKDVTFRVVHFFLY